MSIWQKESGLCHGRGFSGADPLGFLSKALSFFKRPAADGSPQTFTADAGTDNITCAGHSYVDGESVKLTNAGGALPGGLALLTEYYVIYVDANTFQLATTYQKSKDAEQIDITGAGTGVHSVYAMGGGAQWYIIDDKSDPAAQTFTADNTTEQLTVTAHGYGTGDMVWVSNSGGALPTGYTAGTMYYVIRVNADTIKLANSMQNAYAGTAVNITSNGTGVHSIIMVEKYIVVCDVAAPVVNDIDTSPEGLPPKFVKIGMTEANAGRVKIQQYLWYDTTTHTFSGAYSGSQLITSDDADFSYYFYGGAKGFFLLSRIGTSYKIAFVINWIGDANLVEGTDKHGTLQSGVTAGSSIVLQLDTGEAANFTVDNYYFIYDFDGHSWVNSVKVTATDTGADQITVSTLTQNFPAGSVIAAYAHRFLAGGNEGGYSELYQGNTLNNSSSGACSIPYINTASSGFVFHTPGAVVYGYVTMEWTSSYCSRANPNRKGNFGCSEVGIVENIGHNDNTSTGYGHEPYGVVENVVISAIGTLAPGQDGRTDQGNNYMYFVASTDFFTYGGSSNYAVMILDDISTT